VADGPADGELLGRFLVGVFPIQGDKKGKELSHIAQNCTEWLRNEKVDLIL